MTWFLLLLPGLLEICWAVGLKYTAGFTKPIPTTITILSLVSSITLLGIALRTLPLGTAYAIWTGIGSVGTAIFGLIVLNETASIFRLCCIAMIVTAIIGQKQPN